MIDYEVRNGVAIIRFNRPPANAYDLSFHQAFAEAIEQSQQYTVAIIESASDKFFCAGADIKTFATNTVEQNDAMVELARQNLAAMEQSDTLFIAKIQGHALGGGLEIAMGCDVRFAAKGHYLLGLTEIKLGLIPGNGGTQRLLRLVGPSKALELLASGNPFSPDTAANIGLLNQLVELEELDSVTREYAETVAQGPALALAATKKAIRLGSGLALSDGLAVEQQLAEALYDTEDAKEGFNAFIEKRSPTFCGR